jgi:ElaB/YqjD/DUF883 family membrane-anchored ribosome-binding protein
MRTRSKSPNTSDEVARIEDLIADLEKRLQRLSGGQQRGAIGAADTISGLVTDALEAFMERARDKADDAADDIAARASKAGTAAFHRVVDEIEHYPLATLAVAAGIGFLLGSARR